MQISDADFGSRVKGYSLLYLCHRNADPDAIGSAYALQECFEGDLGVPGDMSKVGRQLALAIGAEPLIDPSIEDYDVVVVVDASVKRQIGDLQLGRYGVIDHHLDTGLIRGADFYIQRPTDSTAEIVWSILEHHNCTISREAAIGLVVGIISDTGRFRHARPGSFRAVADLLLSCDLDYAEALAILTRTPIEPSQRIAALKAASRAEIEWNDEWIVVSTEVSAFEGSAAMALVELGADVAFAGGMHGEVCRVSGRARFSATRVGLDLAELMRCAARERGGDGGGHEGAAALEVSCSPGVMLEDLRRRAFQLLER